MEGKIKNIKDKYNNFLLTHNKARIFIEYLTTSILTLLSALCLTTSFKLFMSPNVDNVVTIISGGSGGLSKTVVVIFELFGSTINQYTIYSIAYLLINIPILVLSFKIGIKYAIFSIINVSLVTVMTNFINIDFLREFAKKIACVIEYNEHYYQAGALTRLLLAALFNGSGTVLAYNAGSSSGGIDTIAEYLSFKKRITVGKVFLLVNSCIIFLFGALTLINKWKISQQEGISSALQVILYAYIYQLLVSLYVDFINRSYKKEQVQIVSKNPEIAHLLLKLTKHSATIVKAKGAYTGTDNYIFYIILNSYEKRNVIAKILEFDPHSFVNIVPINQIYGRFAPIKLK